MLKNEIIEVMELGKLIVLELLSTWHEHSLNQIRLETSNKKYLDIDRYEQIKKIEKLKAELRKR